MSGERSLMVDVVADIAGFEALREEWNAATEASLDPNVFLTWEWLRTWWRHFGEPNPQARLHVVVVRDADGLVAAAPLHQVRRTAGPVSAAVLQQISHDAGDYGGVLLVRRPGEAVRALLDHLAGQLGGVAAAVVLSRLTSDGHFLAELRGAAGTSGSASALASRLAFVETPLDGACPFADVRDGYDLKKHLKKHKVRQRMRRLSEKHEVTFEEHTGPTLDEGLARLVAVHDKRWADRRDEFQGLLANAHHEAFLRDAVRALDTVGRLRLLSLNADDQAIAVELDFELAGRQYMFKGAFDPDYAEFSPGQLLTYRAFEDGMARGIEEFDFLRGDHPYKRRWTNDERHLVTVTLTRPGVRGRLAAQRVRALRALDARRRAATSQQPATG